MPASRYTHKYTVGLNDHDEAQIAQIQQNFGPYDIKRHHILRMAIRQGLDLLLALPPSSAQVAK